MKSTPLSKPSKPLRTELLEAIEQRIDSIRGGWCKRKDFQAMELSIRKAQAFLWSFPVATDERVRKYCLEHRDDVARIVIGNHHRALQRLLMEPLKPKKDVKIIPITTQHDSAA